MIKRFKTLNDWNEDIVPISKTKQGKIIEALPKLYKYIKEHYILKEEDLNEKTNEFFDDYYKISKDLTSKEKLGRELKKLGIVTQKVNEGKNKAQYYVYKATWKALRELFEKEHWIDDDVDFLNINHEDHKKQEKQEKQFKPGWYHAEDLRKLFNQAKDLNHLKQMIGILEEKDQKEEADSDDDDEVIEQKPKKVVKKKSLMDLKVINKPYNNKTIDKIEYDDCDEEGDLGTLLEKISNKKVRTK
jgi:hypothetical protein